MAISLGILTQHFQTNPNEQAGIFHDLPVGNFSFPQLFSESFEFLGFIGPAAKSKHRAKLMNDKNLWGYAKDDLI